MLIFKRSSSKSVVLSEWFRPVSDFDECDSPTTNQCQQGCVNEVGGYFCTCHKGYEFSPGGERCLGERFNSVVPIIVDHRLVSANKQTLD